MSPARSFTSGKIKLDDYDFKNSDQRPRVTENVSPPFDPGMLEVFDYPGRYVKSGDGQKIAQAWRDMERTNDHHFHAEGECVSCFPGALVTLEDRSESGLDGEYLALRCSTATPIRPIAAARNQREPPMRANTSSSRATRPTRRRASRRKR